MLLQTVVEVFSQFLLPKFIDECNRLLTDSARCTASTGLWRHWPCLSTTPLWELSANDWKGKRPPAT